MIGAGGRVFECFADSMVLPVEQVAAGRGSQSGYLLVANPHTRKVPRLVAAACTTTGTKVSISLEDIIGLSASFFF